MGVPQDRYTKCAEVQGEHHGSSIVKSTGGIRIGIATVVIQVPGMTRTDTHVFIASREIDITLDSEAKEALGVSNEAGLQPNVQVATASCPEIAFAIALQVGMVIVQRESHTEVNEILQTDCSVNITAKRTSIAMERAFLITLLDHAATGLRPRVRRNIAARTDFNTPLTQRVSVVLMNTGSSTLKPGLGKGKTASD